MASAVIKKRLKMNMKCWCQISPSSMLALLMSLAHSSEAFVPQSLGMRAPCSSLQSAASAISSNGYLIPGIEAIDSQNHDLYETLAGLRGQKNFRLYSVDMLASCEYLPQELFECYSETCEIYPIDDDDVRSIALSSLVPPVRVPVP